MNPNDPNNPQGPREPQQPQPQGSPTPPEQQAPQQPSPQPQQQTPQSVPTAPQPGAEQGGYAAPASVQPQQPTQQPQPGAQPPYQQPSQPATNPYAAQQQSAAQPQNPQEDASYERPQAFGAAPAASQNSPKASKKFPTKIIAIILAAIAGLALIGAAIWLALSLVGGPRLERQELTGYEVSVPQEWSSDNLGTAVQFTSPDEDDASTITLSRSEINEDYASEYRVFYADALSEQNLGTSEGISEYELRDYYHEEVTHAGLEGEQASAAVVDGDDEIGHVFQRVLFGDSYFYTIQIVTFSDSELSGSEQRVISSFAVREEDSGDDNEDDE